MMTLRKIIAPFFPSPPREYSQGYMADLIRAFEQFVTIVRNPGEGRNTTIVLTNLPTSDAAIEFGTLFLHGNELRVAQEGVVPVDGEGMALAMGSVSVSTS